MKKKQNNSPGCPSSLLPAIWEYLSFVLIVHEMALNTGSINALKSSASGAKQVHTKTKAAPGVHQQWRRHFLADHTWGWGDRTVRALGTWWGAIAPPHERSHLTGKPPGCCLVRCLCFSWEETEPGYAVRLPACFCVPPTGTGGGGGVVDGWFSGIFLITFCMK